MKARILAACSVAIALAALAAHPAEAAAGHLVPCPEQQQGIGATTTATGASSACCVALDGGTLFACWIWVAGTLV
jgi:hypothetical protein